MKRSEFLDKLRKELANNNISDIADIIAEYEQHFAFKTADGFSEDEISAKLGDPAGIAAQFSVECNKNRHSGNKPVAVIGLCFTDFAAGIFFILLAAWWIALAAFSICSAGTAICLFFGISPWSLIPLMPYGSAIVCGIAMAALAVLSTVGFIWFAAFLRQIIRVYGRFHHNTMATAAGRPVLPPLAASPSFQPKTKRRLRRTALVSLSAFAAFFVLTMIISMICSGSLEFWHAWSWFGYTV